MCGRAIRREALGAEGCMKAKSTLRPGDRGTKRLVERFGEALARVRYRYDEARRKSIKTAEIIVGEADGTPPKKKFTADALVPLRIGYEEKSLQRQAREAGGRWDRNRRVWLVRYGNIVGTRLEKFLVVETQDKRPNER
jgi:hypothetical protein